MDIEQKDMYETYEFLPLPGSSTETETEQFLVVENNGTYLLNLNKDVQYVSDIQDVNQVLESVESCAVYDEATQQYYVDVNSASEIITVSDRFLLPENGNSEDFTNNYLLPIPEESKVELPTLTQEANNAQEEYAELIIQEPNCSEVPESSLTEITLNNIQWKMLEEKGWVLLEFNDKIFLLNTLGLHDITDNQKMIEKFRNEVTSVIQNTTSEPSSEQKTPQSLLLPEGAPEEAAINIEQNVKTTFITGAAGMLTIEDGRIQSQTTVQADKIPIKALPSNSGTIYTTPTPVAGNTRSLLIPRSPPPLKHFKQTPKKKIQTPKPILKVEKKQMKKECLRLETTFKAEDIPQKFVLGKTVAGKNLVAKVIGVQTGNVANEFTSEAMPVDEQASKIDKLFRQFMAFGATMTCQAEDISRAERAVRQLAALPATRAPLLGCNLLITMIQTTVDENNVSHTGPPMFVTGRAAQRGGRGAGGGGGGGAAAGGVVFVYVPHMLQRMIDNNYEEVYEMIVGGSATRLVCQQAQAGCLLQVHIEQSAPRRGAPRTAITLTKKRLPIQVISKRIPQLHACASCAQCFDSEPELLNHHKTCRLIKADPKPAVVDKEYTQATTKSTRAIGTVPCKVCKTLVRLQNYKRHLRCHGPIEPGDGNKVAPYKCKMCPSTYYYSSSLNKHIMKQHIKGKI